MISETEVVQHVDNVVGSVSILSSQMVQDSDLLLCLPMESFLVSDQLESHVLLVFVVIGLDHLAETAFPDDFQDLVTVGDVIVGDQHVAPGIIIVSVVVGTAGDSASLFSLGSYEVYPLIVVDFGVLVRSQLGAENPNGVVRSVALVVGIIVVGRRPGSRQSIIRRKSAGGRRRGRRSGRRGGIRSQTGSNGHAGRGSRRGRARGQRMCHYSRRCGEL